MLESTCNQICYETRWRKVTAQSAENSDVTGLIKALGVLIKREDKRQKWFRDASDLEWHKREITDKPNLFQDKDALDGLDLWPHLKHITTSGWRDLYLCVWQIKDAIPAQIQRSSKGLYDVIYNNTSLVSSSSTRRRDPSASDVSKEHRDIKCNYNGFWTLPTDLELQTCVDPCISLTITHVLYCKESCIKKKENKYMGSFQRSEEGASGKSSTQECRVSMESKRTGLYYVLEWQRLSAHKWRTKSWMDACVRHFFVGAGRELIAHRSRQTGWRCAAEHFDWGLWINWKSLLKVPPLHSSMELLSIKKRKKKIKHCVWRAQARRPLILRLWPDTFFNYAHEGRELEA